MSVPMEVPRAVDDLVRRLEEGGYETWTVGGAVRDALRGTPRGDWDLATRARPDQVRALFKRTVPIGIEHGTVGVFGIDGVMYEVTTFRRDIVPMGRRAVVAFADTLEEDLARRDFTINAMAWHPLRRELRDPHAGQTDLDRGLLRTVGPASERFREDYLRVLRGLRFAGTLGLAIDEDTWVAMMQAVSGLDHLSMERVREELIKVLTGERPSAALSLYESSGALRHVAPELVRSIDSAGLHAIDALGPHRPMLRVAALFQRALSLECTAGDVADILARLRFSNAEIQQISGAMKGGQGPPPFAGDPAERRRWAADVGRAHLKDVFRLWIAGVRGASETGADRVSEAISLVRRDLASGVPLEVADLAIAGRDLLGRGWSPGPELGRALRSLLELVWEDPTRNDSETLLGLAESLGGEADA